MRLCVVIVNYRKPELTIECLKSIEPELADCPALRVVVVDNASGDDSLDALNAARTAHGWEHWLTIIASPANLGFAGGNNIGIRAEEADAYLLLNNDTIVQRGAFALMLETLEANPKAGLVGPGILDPDGTVHVSCFRNRTPVSEMLGAAKTGPLTRMFRRFDVPIPGAREPEWIGFACVLVRREVFEDIGLLDDNYFMYFEDIDFCIRARKAGWRILHDPRPQVIHLEGGSSDVISSFKGRKRVAKFYYESRARYFATHYGGRLGLWFANVLWMLGRGVSLLREVAGAKQPHTAAHEGRDNWTNWWRPIVDSERDSTGGFNHRGHREGREGLSFPRRRESMPTRGTSARSWIPACAGMTGGSAGMTDGSAGTTKPDSLLTSVSSVPSVVQSVGLVAIGRNEGERLRRCLESATRDVQHAVYVDSGSTDDSIEIAKSLGVDIVQLDMTQPFTAARARNAGIDRLTTHWPELAFVQVIDGDCELVEGWIDAALAFMTANEQSAIVCGRRRERFPEASIYNRLCDLEWDTPVGVAKACGGDALIRLSAFRAVGGFNPAIIAGEEPELCVRVRAAGGTIHRLDHEMTLHDAQMQRFGQWWKRAKRAGHAYAEGAVLHGGPPERHWVREVRSAWVWGVGVWLIALVALPFTYGASVLLLLLYAVLYWRVYGWGMRRGWPRRHARLYATFTTIGKLPQCLGQMTYWWNRLRGRRTRLMEYKHDNSTSQQVNKSKVGAAVEAPPP